MIMLIAFSLLGIGNTLMQTSLNPLVATVVGGNHLASTLTFGQGVKIVFKHIFGYKHSVCFGIACVGMGRHGKSQFLWLVCIGHIVFPDTLAGQRLVCSGLACGLVASLVVERVGNRGLLGQFEKLLPCQHHRTDTQGQCEGPEL